MAKAMEPALSAPPKPAVPDADVMDAMQGQPPSAKKQMGVVDIIRKSFSQHGELGDFNTFMKKLGSLLLDKNNSTVQMGNTVFLLQRTAPDTVEVHTFSSETPQNLIKNYVGIAKFLKNQGIKRAVTYADSPGYVEIAKKTGLPVKVGQAVKTIGGKAKPMYTFELEL